jgi:hypothetical protein
MRGKRRKMAHAYFQHVKRRGMRIIMVPKRWYADGTETGGLRPGQGGAALGAWETLAQRLPEMLFADDGNGIAGPNDRWTKRLRRSLSLVSELRGGHEVGV